MSLSTSTLAACSAHVVASQPDLMAQPQPCAAARTFWNKVVAFVIAGAAGQRRQASEGLALHALLQHAIPVVLRLAASEDEPARALFRPLVSSLVHWLARDARR